jgi:hypothetical protein
VREKQATKKRWGGWQHPISPETKRLQDRKNQDGGQTRSGPELVTRPLNEFDAVGHFMRPREKQEVLQIAGNVKSAGHKMDRIYMYAVTLKNGRKKERTLRKNWEKKHAF